MSENITGQKTDASLSYAAWATAWGPMGAVAGPSGLRRVVLPHYQMDDLLQLLPWEDPGALRDDRPFERLIQLTRDYFNGKGADFAEIACDLSPETTMTGMVHRACRAIPYGQTRSYTALAEMIGRPDATRAVATAVGKNRIPLVVPCHRVLRASGDLGGFSAPGGVALKQRMLDLEKRAATSR